MQQKSVNLLARLALFGAAFIWGTSFIVVKNTVDVFTPNILLAFRFTIGCLILAVVFHKRLNALDLDFLKKGCLTGVMLYLAYSVQTIGITDTTPGKNAFLTAVYCVLVPFFFWAVDKTRPDLFHFAAAFLCIVGIGLVTLDGDLSIRMGDALTLLSGIFYACHVVAIAKLGRGKDPVVFTILQFATAAVCSWVVGLATESLPTQVTVETVGGLLFLAVFATAGSLLLQNVGQRYTDPTAASILLSLEAPFGVLFSALFYGEELNARLLIGFAFIFVAILTSETKLSFLTKLLPGRAAKEG